MQFGGADCGVRMSCDEREGRFDTEEMKLEIQRRVGVTNAERYFMLLGRYFGRGISKSEFDRFCIRVIGRDNLSLHNRFINGLLRNATRLSVEQPPLKRKRNVESLSVVVENGYKGSCLESLCRDGFPLSPKRGRTPTPRSSKFRDKPSPLGPLGKSPNITSEDSPSKVLEQHGATELLSLGSRPPVEINSVEDGEEVEQTAGSPSIRSRSPVTAPFGVCINRRGSKKLPFKDSSTRIVPVTDTCFNHNDIPDTNTLRNRLAKKVKAEGLEVSLDFVNYLNHGVDIFLKRLITPTLEIARSRSRNGAPDQQNGKIMHGVNESLSARHTNKPRGSVTASALDFRVAMELNPTVLGEDWPIHLENITCRQLEK